MSAFVVSHKHIDAILTFANMKKMEPELCHAANMSERGSLTDIGRILLAENERSVCHRYPDCVESDRPGVIGEEAISYNYKLWPDAIHMAPTALCVQVIKACDCFDYQACETDDYEESIAHRIIERIRQKAVRSFPAYDNAKWSIS